MDPEVGFDRPQIVAIRVVFPAPFGPRSAKISPDFTDRLTPSSALRLSPYVLCRSRISKKLWIAFFLGVSHGQIAEWPLIRLYRRVLRCSPPFRCMLMCFKITRLILLCSIADLPVNSFNFLKALFLKHAPDMTLIEIETTDILSIHKLLRSRNKGEYL